MNNNILPVMLLKGLVLLPNNDIRLEFENELDSTIVDVAEKQHEGNILVVSQGNTLEEIPELGDLPKIGVIAKITHKIKLPNKKIRVIITGLKRARIDKYINLSHSSEILKAEVMPYEIENINTEEELFLINKLYKEMESYVKSIPYTSNSILSLILKHDNLSSITDVIAPNLGITLDRLKDYLNENSSLHRSEMILQDIYKEKEMYKVEKRLDAKVRNDLDNNQKEFILKEKLKLIKEELGESAIKDNEVDNLRKKIDELNCSDNIKNRLNSELKRYDMMSQTSPETNIVRNYIDWLLNLPWSIYTEDNDDLIKVREILDDSHYGLESVKTRIIEFLAVKQMTNSLKSPIICLIGPPGVGKTSLAFSIAKAVNRNFVKISVGGINDEAEIKGHRRTYLGASPGRIIESMKKAKSSNPVFLIDEIDKMTRDYKGDPASALLEVLDPEQNKYFSDNYIEEEFDLSNVMFIATANYEQDIPEALRDRLEIIKLSGYTEYEKVDIAKKHLIPKILEDHGIGKEKINFSDETILNIIKYYTKEAGVRELERQLATVIRKEVTNTVTNQIKPRKKTITNITKYLGKEKYKFNKIDDLQVGVVNGLAYTSFGGDTLPIEVNFYKGKGNLVLTGSLGEVMKESAHIALSYIKSNYEKYNIDYDKLINNDIHIHVPDGAVPKDGPSAGIALTTALISALTNIKIDKTIAMTGEITLRGNVLAVGGLKEKSIGAHRSGIKTIIIPEDNINDLDDIPNEIKKDITYIPVKRYLDVIDYTLK